MNTRECAEEIFIKHTGFVPSDGCLKALNEYASLRVEEAINIESDKPDFNEWIETKSGKDCNNFENLKEQKYLTNRLSLAFDAGRDCIWSQYLKQKRTNEQLTETNRQLVEALEKIVYEIKNPTNYIIHNTLDKINTIAKESLSQFNKEEKV